MRAPWFGRFARQIAFDVMLHVTIATAAGVLLFLVIDFVEVGNRASTSATSGDFAKLSLFTIPRVLKILLPATAPIGAVTAIGAHMRRLEIAAIFASGASPLAVVKPVILAGLVIAASYVAIVEWLVPPAAVQANTIRQRMGLPYVSSYWGRHGW